MTDQNDADMTPDQPTPEGGDGEQPKKKRRRRRKRKGPGEGAERSGAAEGASEEPAQKSEGSESSGGSGRRRERGRDDDRSGKRRGGGRSDGGRSGKRRDGERHRPFETEEVVEPAMVDRSEARRAAVASGKTALQSFDTEKTFADLGLTGDVLKGADDAGFVHPTKIQAALIPVALTGRDVLGQAKTGTGKTAAFALPLLQMCEPGVSCQALILGPTRELAVQIHQDIEELGRRCGIRSVPIYGGQSISTQAKKLEKHPEIVVGTPGRVLDMVGRGHLSFRNIRFAVLDEVDRMFDIGFRDDIRKTLRQCPTERQTIFVSATISPDIEKLARQFMRNPEKLVVASGSLTVELVEQHYLTVNPWDKKRLLAHLLTHEDPALTLVFCRMKRTVDEVVRYLEKKGIEAHAMHGDMSQSARNKTMERFRFGKLAVLVASDVASRGLDVEGITHVVNYDLPEDPDLYIHRIGRTARAGRDGIAWSLVTPAQGPLLTEIEVLINAEIPRLDYPDFESTERPEGWRDETPSGRPAVVVEGFEKTYKSRFEAPDPTQVAGDDPAELAKKFPGGIVPTKLPPKVMRGRVRTRGR